VKQGDETGRKDKQASVRGIEPFSVSRTTKPDDLLWWSFL
jgi:hypothetical protein